MRYKNGQSTMFGTSRWLHFDTGYFAMDYLTTLDATTNHPAETALRVGKTAEFLHQSHLAIIHKELIIDPLRLK